MIVGLLEVVSMWKRRVFSILQVIGRKLEKNTEEHTEILLRINDNKVARNQRDGDIKKEITDVQNTQQEFQETFHCQGVTDT